MEENNELKEEIAKVQEQKPKKDKKNIIIVCLIIIILLLIALLTFVLLNNDKKESNSGKTDKPEIEEKEDAINEIEVDFDDQLVNELYNKYHSGKNNGIYMDNLSSIESISYKNDVTYIKDLDTITYEFSKKIYDKVYPQVKKDEKCEDGMCYVESSKIEPLLKKEFKQLFGNNIEFSNKLFVGDCIEFYYEENNGYRTDLACGGAGSVVAWYNKFKATKTDNTLNIYERVKIIYPGSYDDYNCEEDDYVCYTSESYNPITYKWVYNKDIDGNYYLEKIEKVK